MCLRVKDRGCDPGMKGCVLFGRFVFSDAEKNRPKTRAKFRARRPDSGGC